MPRCPGLSYVTAAAVRLAESVEQGRLLRSANQAGQVRAELERRVAAFEG